MIKKVKLYVNVSKEKAVETADKVRQALLDNGYEIVEEGADLVIGFGGDGTLLKWLNEQATLPKEKYIGINCGTLGFMQDFEIEDAEEFVKGIPNYVEKQLRYVELVCVTRHPEHKICYAINDFAILNTEDKTFRANVFVDDELLETYVGTGLLFASATGSTARNISSVGSIMFPEIPAIQMTPIEPIVNSKIHCIPKSVCIPSDYITTLVARGGDDIKIMCDGMCVYRGRYEEITVKLSSKYLTVLTDKKNSFTKKIKEKLI